MAPDELLVDERFVAVHLANKGLFVFTACSHAGLINVLTHAAERFPRIPLFFAATVKGPRSSNASTQCLQRRYLQR